MHTQNLLLSRFGHCIEIGQLVKMVNTRVFNWCNSLECFDKSKHFMFFIMRVLKRADEGFDEDSCESI